MEQFFNVAEYAGYAYWTGSDALSLDEHALHPDAGAYRPVNVPEQDGWHLGLSWESPRQFEAVVVHFDETGVEPEAGDVKLQWYRHNWPTTWRGGWTHIDDPYNGSWIRPNGDVRIDGRTWTFTFDPLDITEVPRVEESGPIYRQSYKLRLVFKDGEGIRVRSIEAYSSSVWREAKLRIELKGAGIGGIGKPDVFNGGIISLDSSDPRSALLTVRYADCDAQFDRFLTPIPPDRTVVTIGEKQRVSFAVADALDSPVWIPDLGVYVRTADGPTLDQWKKQLAGGPPPIYDRILSEPEQSYERARSEIPQLVKTRQNRYLPIGCDSNRHEFCIRYNGNIFMDKNAMKPLGRDLKNVLWPGTNLTFKFPTGDPPDFREREDATKQSALRGYLPIYTSEWKDREFYFTRTDFACYLDQTPWEEHKKRGDEPLVAMSRLQIRNTTEERRSARYWLVIEQPEKLEVRDGFVYAVGKIWNESVPIHAPAQETRWEVKTYPQPRLRAQIRTNGKGTAAAAACSYEPNFIASHPNAIAYDVELEPRSAHEVDIVIVFTTLPGGADAVAKLDYDAKLSEMIDYWESLIAQGAQITTPEPIINDYIKATVPHIAITGDRDVDSGHYLLPAGTYSYNVCANEACHQIRSLDMRAHHERALAYLQPYLDCQGSRGLHGKFKTQEGVLHGLRVAEDRDYQTFSYNLDHGFVHFALCEHYFLTRDRDWASKIAPNLVAACDFVTRERRSTMKTDKSGEKVWEYGLIPPGHLEDNPEWLFWYAVNSYCYRGMSATARVLADIAHPEAERVSADAEAYRQDIRRAMSLSMQRSPVTRLADGTFVPFQPTRCHIRGRDLGWIRDSLYGPIHAIECGVLEPNEDASTWLLKDYEDNVAVSRYRGRQVDLEKFWFSQAGNTIQSGLLPMVMVHLKRGRPEHAIRALYNALGQNLYADVRCFTEHPVAAFGLGAGPFYKTPDENCWINWLRHCMLSERGFDDLEIAPGAPRAWFAPGKSFEVKDMATYFGPVSYRIESGEDEIRAVVDPPKRNPPNSIVLHFRHPGKKAIRGVTVNGKAFPGFDPSGPITLPGSTGRAQVAAAY